MSVPAGAVIPQRPVRRLDRKLGTIATARYTPDDFVIADAKDADMAFGLTSAGPAAEPGRYRTCAEYLDAMQALVAQDQLDILLTSASNGERLTQGGSLGDITLAIRANDSTDIWNSRGGRYATAPSRPFRTADLAAVRPFCDLVLYSVTFNNDLDRDLATLEAYGTFRRRPPRSASGISWRSSIPTRRSAWPPSRSGHSSTTRSSVPWPGSPRSSGRSS